MNRRGFLRFLGAGAAGLVLDPEMLLWRPGAKTILLPPTQVFRASKFIGADWLSLEALRLLQHELEVTKYFVSGGRYWDPIEARMKRG